MRVFVLGTGRCGTTTLSKACEHIENYTCSHEANLGIVGPQRLEFPDNHIEIDPRLSWFVGDLDERYGEAAYYVHMIRNEEDTVNSFYRWWGPGLQGYAIGVLMKRNPLAPDYGVCRDHYRVLNANVRLFLKDKPRKRTIWLHEIESGFRGLWEDVGAIGDYERAIEQLRIKHNSNDFCQPAVPTA